MIRASFRPWLVIFKFAFPLPTLAFIIGNSYSQAVTPAFGIVVNQRPVAVAQTNDLGSRTGIREFAVRHRAPGFAVVTRLALVQSFGRRAIVAHQRVQRTVFAPHDARLNVAAAYQWR